MKLGVEIRMETKGNWGASRYVLRYKVCANRKDTVWILARPRAEPPQTVFSVRFCKL